VTSVLICDDRPLVRAALTPGVRAITTVADIGWVTDAVELLRRSPESRPTWYSSACAAARAAAPKR